MKSKNSRNINILPINQGWRSDLAEEISNILAENGVSDIRCLPLSIKILGMVQKKVNNKKAMGK